MPNNMNIPVNPNTPQNELATFAGGCFWCMAAPFENLDGVISLSVGYTGGDKENPTYQEVCTQRPDIMKQCKFYLILPGFPMISFGCLLAPDRSD